MWEGRQETEKAARLENRGPLPLCKPGLAFVFSLLCTPKSSEVSLICIIFSPSPLPQMAGEAGEFCMKVTPR